MIRPSLASYARRCPSSPPEKTTPGRAVVAADCAGLQPGVASHPGCGARQATSPVFTSSAYRPPPAFGLSINGGPKIDGCPPSPPGGGAVMTTSDTGTKTLFASVAM